MIPSIRRRLLLILLTTIGLAWGGVVALSYYLARHEVNELFDAQLAQSARVLLALVTSDRASGSPGVLEQRFFSTAWEAGDSWVSHHRIPPSEYERKVSFQVWERGGKLVLKSATAPEVPLSEVRAGFSDTTVAGHAWRVVSLGQDDGPILVQVGERYDIRGELAI